LVEFYGASAKIEGVMKKLLATVAFMGGLASASVAWSETLADALIAAYKTSHLLDQNQAVLRAADEDVAVAVAKLRPVVSFALQGSWRRFNNDTATFTLPQANYTSLDGSVGLSANVLIYAGGRGKLGIELAKQSVLATRSALVNVEQNVLLGAVAAFVDVRLKSEIVGLRQSNVRLIVQELRAAKDRFEVGEVTLTDVSLAEARLAAAQAGLSSAQGSLEVAREAYKAAIGDYPDQLASLQSNH
jgi:outer membrane protein